MVLEITPKMNQCAHITIKQHVNLPILKRNTNASQQKNPKELAPCCRPSEWR